MAIKGKVIEYQTQEGIAYADIFVPGTSYKTQTDENGYFLLENPIQLPFTINVTAVDYHVEQLTITMDNLDDSLLIALQIKADVLNAFEFTFIRDGWARYGHIFLRELLGVSAFSTQCKIKNTEYLKFYYDKDLHILRVFSPRPIVIENKATGYEITYWMEDFQFDMKSKMVFNKGALYFKDKINPTTKRKKRTKWIDNRQIAFLGSFNHFVRSVYTGQVLENGFEMRVLIKIEDEARDMYLPKINDTVSLLDVRHISALITQIYTSPDDINIALSAIDTLLKWSKDTTHLRPIRLNNKNANPDTVRDLIIYKFQDDSIQFAIKYFEYKNQNTAAPIDSTITLLNAPKPLAGDIKISGNLPLKLKSNPLWILYKDPISVDTLLKLNKAGDKLFTFENYLHITYTKEWVEKEYFILKNPNESKFPRQFQESIISLWNDATEVVIYEDGNFYEPYNILMEGYWSFEKMDKILPLNYHPYPHK